MAAPTGQTKSQLIKKFSPLTDKANLVPQIVGDQAMSVSAGIQVVGFDAFDRSQFSR